MKQTFATGFSLIELLFVIGLIAVMALAVLVGYPHVRDSQRAQQEREAISGIAAGIKQSFLLRGYTGLNNDIANQANVFPSRMNENNHAPGQEITSSWGGLVTVAPAGATNQHFTITYQDVPEASCTPFVKSLVNIFERVNVGGTVVRNTLGGATVNPDPGTIIDACTQSATVDVIVETM